MADGWKRKMISCLNKILVVLISFPVLFVSTSFLVNIGREMSLLGFRTLHFCTIALTSSLRTWRRRGYAAKSVEYAGRKNLSLCTYSETLQLWTFAFSKRNSLETLSPVSSFLQLV